MTQTITCNRCDKSVPTDEWKTRAHTKAEFNFVEHTDTGDYERGPEVVHLCGECSVWFAGELGEELPAKWLRNVPYGDGDGEDDHDR